MPVIALSSQNLHSEPHASIPNGFTPSSNTRLEDIDITDTLSKPQQERDDLGVSLQPLAPLSLDADSDSSDMPIAGPSQNASASTSRPVPVVPPPPHPRRHKSGVLMSRMRATSGGQSASRDGAAMAMSKSYGDLRMVEPGAQQLHTPEHEGEDGGDFLGIGQSRREWRRADSEGYAQEEGSSTMWDNRLVITPATPSCAPRLCSRSARFYHHIHSRPPSRAGSRQTSPSRSLATTSKSIDSAHSSPIYLRRSVNLQPMTSDTTSQARPIGAALSPNQSFLQQHIPPTFPLSPEQGHSSLALPDMRSHMVILTPTTQEWRELKQLSRIENDDGGVMGGEDDSSESEETSRRNSVTLDGPPAVRRSVSADFLGQEKDHQRDPGASPEKMPTVPMPFLPSPTTPDVKFMKSHPSMDEIDPDQPILMMQDQEDSPVRFNSIGKRPSLGAIKGIDRSNVSRTKTKRERERERLFKDLDDELEADRLSDGELRPGPGWNTGVQEIGQGGGLGSRPSSSDSLSDGLGSPPSNGNGKIAAPTMHFSPTQPIKPSPLHAQSMSSAMDRSSSDSGDDRIHMRTPSPGEDSPTINLPSPTSQVQNLEIIRDYARNLVSPRPQYSGDLAPTSGASTPSPSASPRPGRRRDWANRVSLVAGRIVQPLASLPGRELQSFSPFRSPPIGPNKPSLVPPSFNRLDSNISIAPSIGAPSECGTPTSETAGGVGGRGIEDYVILTEAGKGAYGLVMRAKVKGTRGEPVGDEVIIKYIVKARILADCWKKHKVLGPIPVEIHVMDQLRHLLYNPPLRANPWDPMRAKPHRRSSDSVDTPPTSPDSPQSDISMGSATSGMALKVIASEIKHSPERGHPNIAKLLDFFEDKEFYYCE